MKRKVLEIKKSILRALKQEKEMSLKTLEIKIHSGSQTVLSQIEELEFLRIVKVTKHEKNDLTGRPYTSVTLTEFGERLI